MQPRNYNSIVVEQTLRAIRRGPGAIAARHYARPVHINASEIDVTSPRRPRRPSTVDTVTNDNAGGSIHRGRTVVRLHTKNKRTEKSPLVLDEPELMVMTTLPESPACMPTVSEEGLAKKGTIKRHTSAGIKVPVNDDRRPSVTDEILREQEALFDTMIMEEMEVQKERRKSYPVDIDDKDKKKSQKNREMRKKSIAAGMVFGDLEKQAKKNNWKLNYDVIIEESGIEPVSFTFKLNKTKQDSGGVDVGSDNGKLDANHNVVIKSHDDNNSNENKNTKKHVKSVSKKQTNNDNSDDVCMSVIKTKVAAKKKIIVKKKVIKKKESGKQEQNKQQLQEKDQEQGQQKKKLQTPSPPKSKKKGPKTETAAVATATAAVITPFVRASFGKTFISPSQVSSTKSKFEKPKPKPKIEQKSSPPPPPPKLPSPPPDSSSDDDESSSDEESSSLCSDSSSTGSSSTYYDSDEYGDKRIACSISSFDSGLPSSPVPATDPIGRKNHTNVYY